MAHSPLICFDLGGVLVRLSASIEEAIAYAGLPARDIAITNEFHTAHAQLINEHQTGQLSSIEYYDRLSLLLEGAYRPSEIELAHAAWLRGPYQGTTELIQEIKEAGYETCCLSNTNDAHWNLLINYPNVSLLDRCEASHLLGLAKPQPSIYETMQRKLGRRANDILFFDDDRNNIVAAHVAGWEAVQIDPKKPTCEQIRRGLKQHGVLLNPNNSKRGTADPSSS